ncbi:MAG: hemerythrin domain-containing protein [Deltaproteobacteria bacterium]|nr:hemerythrin domain-containing protein [Deltaproteobacteria bacterium]
MRLVGVLSQEHRIIENILAAFNVEVEEITAKNNIDPVSMDLSIDFIRTFTDQAHHGKEENILFRELSKKKLLPAHARIMGELRDEHQYSRGIVGKWMVANRRLSEGEDTSQEIISYLKELTQFYSQHIKKEDEQFFYPVLDYFENEELAKMEREFNEFDANVLHWRYAKVESILKERLGAGKI